MGLRPRGKNVEPTEKANRSIYIVFVATVEIQTGSLCSRNIAGIFEDAVEAKKLEKDFNATAREAEGRASRAFSVRHRFPYVAPLVKD